MSSEKVSATPFAEFLTSSPPAGGVYVTNLSFEQSGFSYRFLSTPALTLHCSACGGARIFRYHASQYATNNPIIGTVQDNYFLKYRCSNCVKEIKHYAIAAGLLKDQQEVGIAYKYGELPPFGPYLNPKLINMLGESADEFRKGYQCETLGYGVAAFTYYRRVVVAQKNKIFCEILKVAERTNETDAIKETLRSAIAQSQFAKSLKLAKGANLGTFICGRAQSSYRAAYRPQ